MTNEICRWFDASRSFKQHWAGCYWDKRRHPTWVRKVARMTRSCPPPSQTLRTRLPPELMMYCIG